MPSTATTTSYRLPLTAHPAIPGAALVLVITAVATGAGRWFPVVGAPVFGILLGLLAGTLLRGTLGARGQTLDAGARLAVRQPLQIAIVVLGFGLSLREVARVGVHSLPVMLGTLTVALVGARVGGTLLRIDKDTRTLIGVGTGICGASAIAAVTAVVDAAEADVAYAIGTIFTFNVAAVLLYPTFGHLLGLSQHAFGLWSGTAINDTSSVVAASAVYGSVASGYGVVVKLTRSLMIVPICTYLGAATRRRSDSRLPWRRMLPLFLVGFVAASAVNTAGLVPTAWHPALSETAVVLITVAMTGIGLTTRPSALRVAGPRPLILGGILWAAVGATSLLLQLATGTL